MKFSFEADMEKGKCSACPFLETNDNIDEGYWSCALTNEATALEVEPEECPLKEEVSDDTGRD